MTALRGCSPHGGRSTWATTSVAAVVLLCAGMPTLAQQPPCSCNASSTPQPTAAPITPAPVQTLTTPLSVDVAVLTAGIALLLMLFAVSFYFTVVWPKRAFLEYRRRFEEIVKADLVSQDMKLLKIGDASPVYGGAAAPNADRRARRIPTMKEIDAALAAAEAQSSTNLKPQQQGEDNDDRSPTIDL